MERATLVSLSTFDENDADLAFALLQDPLIEHPDELPTEHLRTLLRDLCGRGTIRLDFLAPLPDLRPSETSEAPCALSLLLATTLLRAAVRTEGHSTLGALVAGSGVPGAPCPSRGWSQAALWLNAHGFGAFRGGTFGFVTFATHLSREMGISLWAPDQSSPLEDWVIRVPSDRRYMGVSDVCNDIRHFPSPLNAFATLVMEYPIRIWGPSSSFLSSARDALSTLVSSRVPLPPLPQGAVLADRQWSGAILPLISVGHRADYTPVTVKEGNRR